MNKTYMLASCTNVAKAIIELLICCIFIWLIVPQLLVYLVSWRRGVIATFGFELTSLLLCIRHGIRQELHPIHTIN